MVSPLNNLAQDAVDNVSQVVSSVEQSSPNVLIAQANAIENVRSENVEKRRNALRRSSSSSSDYGQITAQQYHLIQEYKKGNITAEELMTQFLQYEIEKIHAKVSSGKLSDEDEQNLVSKARTFVHQLVENFKLRDPELD